MTCCLQLRQAIQLYRLAAVLDQVSSLVRPCLPAGNLILSGNSSQVVNIPLSFIISCALSVVFTRPVSSSSMSALLVLSPHKIIASCSQAISYLFDKEMVVSLPISIKHFLQW